MTNEAKIIQATTTDYQSIAEIYNEYIRSGTATMDEELKTSEHIAAWVNKFNDRERLYVLRKEEQVIGWCIIKKYSNREGYRYACETAVYLTAAETGKGYGSMMKRYLIEQCRALNYRHMVAKIFATNTVSIRYNEKLGYTIVGTQKEIGFRNGKWQDIVIMQNILKD